MTAAPICQYCKQPAVLKPDSEVYGDRSFGGMVWACPGDCDAYVGCNKGSHVPFGVLANAELRAAKMAAHAAFDPTWRGPKKDGVKRSVARSAAYVWLAAQLGITSEECHLGQFDLEMCARVIKICREAAARKAA